MSTDCSNDVIVLEDATDSTEEGDPIVGSETETRPLMQLFLRLISNDTKQSTILTNAQIVAILKIEYDITIKKLHDLEVDIYLNTIKRFLKEWPQWDVFDNGINRMRKRKKTPESIKETLENNYKSLKKYIKVNLDATIPLSKKSLSKITAETSKHMQSVDTNDVILEVYCTRDQLNELVYDRPNPELQNSIFHISDVVPNSISVNSLPMMSILHWWGIQVSIETKFLSLTWSTMHHVKHILVNTKNGPRILNQELNEKLQIKEQKRATDDIEISKICKLFDVILQQYGTEDNTLRMVQALFGMMKSELALIDGDIIKVPAAYRRHTNKYPYYRKLCKELKTQPLQPTKQYEFYIEETMSPMHVFYIAKIGDAPSNVVPLNMSLTVECTECKVKFTGLELTFMKDHFDVYHANEPDWICTNCQQVLPMLRLTAHGWHHICPNP